VDTKTKTLKAVSDPTRLSLLQYISKGEVSACKLKCCKVSQPAVSQHLSTLLCAGLVKVRNAGSKRFYSITQKARKILDDINKW
jgi:DNA-binding transcriptional ArsR family regulator